MAAFDEIKPVPYTWMIDPLDYKVARAGEYDPVYDSWIVQNPCRTCSNDFQHHFRRHNCKCTGISVMIHELALTKQCRACGGKFENFLYCSRENAMNGEHGTDLGDLSPTYEN